MAEPYKDNGEHLLAELACLDLLIQQEVVRFRSSASGTHDVFKGMYISDNDVDRVFHSSEEAGGEEMDRLAARAASLATEVEARRLSSLEQGVPLALPRVALLFGLSGFEQRLILLALAPELDPKYERLFGYLHDDISRRRVTVGLALRLLCLTPGERVAATAVFSPQAPLCRALGVSMLVVDMQELLQRFADVENSLRSIFRQALLLQASIYLDHFDVLTAEESKPASHRQALLHLMEQMSWMVFLGTESAWRPGDLFSGHEFVSVELPMPDAAERKCIWMALANQAVCGPDVDWDDLSVKFRLTPGRMKSAFHSASSLARLRQREGVAISRADLYSGCQSQSNRKLAALAQKMVTRHGWSDIVLTPNALAQLHEICAHLKHRQRVYWDWGFESKLSRGKGLCVLFYGQSGVGKTMAAEVLAHELKLEIYKIDLSTVVSKYIGETEKNLSKIFQEAEDSNAILFFDEADALFGKRSEVKDAHDRYANIEIN